jgi:hypothetical protein
MRHPGDFGKKRPGCMVVDLNWRFWDFNRWVVLLQDVLHFEVDQCTGGFQLFVVVLIGVVYDRREQLTTING